MKYVICKDQLGNPCPLVFDEGIPHGAVAHSVLHVGWRIVSAGYVDRVPGKAGAGWEWQIIQRGSMTAVFQPRPEDLQLLRDFLNFGLSGPQLTAMTEMDRVKRRAQG